MAITISYSHFAHVAFVSIPVFQTFVIEWYLVDEFSWNKVVRGDGTGPTNGTRSEKVWEPLL